MNNINLTILVIIIRINHLVLQKKIKIMGCRFQYKDTIVIQNKLIGIINMFQRVKKIMNMILIDI